MKRFLIMLLIASGILSIATVGSLLVFGKQDEDGAEVISRWFWFLYQDRPPNYNDCDEKWSTTMRLWSIQMVFGQFNRPPNKDERDAFRNVKSLNDLWAIFQKRHLVPSANDENYFCYTVDGWGQPFILFVTNTNDSTILHISSRGPTYYRWVELTVKDNDYSVRAGP